MAASITDRKNRPPKYRPAVLLVLFSHPPHKPVEYGGAGWANQEDLGVRVRVRRLKEFVAHSAPIENGKSSGDNADIKFLGNMHSFKLLLEDERLNKEFQRNLRRSGWPYRPRNIIGLSDDNVPGVAADLWPRFKLKLAAAGVDPALLDNIATKTHFGAPFVELNDFVHIVSVPGATAFFNMYREAAHEAGYADKLVPFIDKLSCRAARLSHAEGAPIKKFEDIVKMTFLHTPNGLAVPFTSPETPFPMTAHFVCKPDAECAPQERGRPIADYYDSYLANDSVRKAMLDAIVTWAIPEDERRQRVVDFRAAKEHMSMPVRKGMSQRRKEEIRLVQVTDSLPGEYMRRLGPFHVSQQTPRNVEDFMRKFSMEFNLEDKRNKGLVLATPDGIIIPPNDSRDPMVRVRTVSLVSSAVVAVQTGVMNIPIIALGRDGCHDYLKRGATVFHNHGVCRDLHRSAIHERMPPNERIVTINGIAHLPTAYIDFVDGKPDTSDRDLYKAGRQAASFRLRGYNPMRLQERFAEGDEIDNISKPSGMIAVAHLMTAEHYCRNQIDASERFTAFLAKPGVIAGYDHEGFGYVTGGMKKEPARSAYKRYIAEGGRWFSTFSIPNILKLETDDGRLPSESHFARVSRTIDERIFPGIIAHSDIFSYWKGAWGTLQEGGAIRAVKIFEPEKHGHKPEIYFAPSLQGKTSMPISPCPVAISMEMVLGVEDTQRLIKDHGALADRNIFLATREEENFEMTVEGAKSVLRTHRDMERKAQQNFANLAALRA